MELNVSTATCGTVDARLVSESSRNADVATISTTPSQRRLRISDIHALQHFGGGFVEQLAAAKLFETLQQLGGAHALLLGTADVVDHFAAMHHDQAVAQDGGLLHGVRHHERGEL